MSIEELIKLLEQYPSDTQVRFVEYDQETGKTLRWHLAIACNTEYQKKIDELWFIRCVAMLAETD